MRFPTPSRRLQNADAIHFTPNFLSYCCLILVVFVDNVGLQFSTPVQVPYTLSLGGTIEVVGTSLTINAFGRVVGGFIMPVLSDKWSKKGAIFLSMVGSLVAYTVAGTANFVDKVPIDGGWSAAIWVYIVGRAIGGLFGNTMSLCIAFVGSLTAPNMKLLKQRNSLLFSSNMASGIALAPIGGALGGAFGLYLPFYFSAGVAVSGLAFCLIFLKDKAEIEKVEAKRQQVGLTKAAAAGAAAASVSATDESSTRSGGPVLVSGDEERSLSKRGARAASKENEGTAPTSTKMATPKESSQKKKPGGGKNPWLDATIIMLAVNAGCFSLIMTFSPVILPALLTTDPSYGLLPASNATADVVSEVQSSVSTVLGLLAIPNGVSMLLMQSVGYLFLSRYFSNRVLCSVGCVIGGTGMLCNSFTSAIWQIAICNAIMGVGFGTFLGAYINVPNAYIMKFLAHASAQARTIPTIFMSIGAMAGPQITSQLMGEPLDTEVGRWLLRCAAAGMVVMSISLFFIISRIEYLIKFRAVDGSFEKKDEEDHKVTKALLSTTAEQAEAFETQVQAQLKARLEQGHYHMWNGVLQTAIVRLIDDALPPLREWNEQTGGREHLEDLASLFYHLEDFDEILALESEFGIDLHTHLGIDDETLHLSGVSKRSRDPPSPEDAHMEKRSVVSDHV